MLTFQFIITLIITSKSTCNYPGCSHEATCDVEFVAEAVYGCGGTWSTPGVENGQYLCGDGYSICDDHVYASSLGLTEELCLNSTIIPTNYFYASLQSSSGYLICDNIGYDDLFGCASYESDSEFIYFSDTIQCGPFGAQVGTSKVTAWQYGWYFGQDSTEEFETAIHITSETYNIIMGGVLCCRDTVGSYSSTMTYTTSQSQYIRHVSCGDTLSGNITSGDVDSYNFEVVPDEPIYLISDCDQNIKFRVHEMVGNSKNVLADSLSGTYWLQCDTTAEEIMDFWIYDTTYGIDIYTENYHNLSVQYNIYVTCGKQPEQIISPDCYIGCGQHITGYVEYGRPQFCEITSSTKEFGGNIFSGGDQRLRIYPDNWWESQHECCDQMCMDDCQLLEWYNMNQTQTYYLQIDRYQSSNYEISMECRSPRNLSGAMHCPYGIMTGTLQNDDVAWYKIHFDSNLPATFDGCSSDDGIRISLYDSLLLDHTYWLQYTDRCISDAPYAELYPSDNDTYYLKISNSYNFEAKYNISYLCEIKRQKSTNYGYINCGDFISDSISFGDRHLYTFNSTMNDRIYIIADCYTGENDIEIDFFDGNNWQTSQHEYNWQCLESRLYISQYLNYDDRMEFELYMTMDSMPTGDGNLYNMSNYYGFNVYCGEKPKITQANGVINCDQVLSGVIDQKQTFFYKIMNHSNVSNYIFAGYIDSGSLKLALLDVSGNQQTDSNQFSFGCAKQYLTLKDLNNGYHSFDYLAIFNDNEQPTNYSISMQCNPSEIYIGSVTCGDIISGNLTNDEIHSYNLIHQDSNHLYAISSCNTNTQIAISLLTHHEYGSIDYLPSCTYDYWFQCNHETAAVEEWLDTYSMANYTIDVFNPFADNDTYYSYEIHVSCGDPPQQQITSADCYIGCGESVTGYYEYGNPQFCEITSFTKGFGGNIFSGCGSDYDQVLNIFGGNVFSEWDWDDQCVGGEYQKLSWYVWDGTITYYLQIDGHSHSSSGNYKVSMDCGVQTNLTGEIHCPYDRMEGSLQNNEIAWYKVHFDSDLPATFDGCLSDDDIRISLYDSLLSDAYDSMNMQHRDRCIGDRDGYYELYPSNNDTYYIQIRNDNDFSIDANLTYNVSYFCEIKRRKSTNYGIMNCGDFISGVIDIGDAHLYTFNSTMDDRIYIVSDCNTDEGIEIDFFDGYDWQQSWDDYNWQCDFDTPYVSQWVVYGNFMEFEIFRKRKPISEAIYGFNIYCGEKPQEPIQYAGRINCGDHNILGRNNMFFNFSNPEIQTVIFSVCSISFEAILNLNESNGNVIKSISTSEYSYYEYNDHKDCPHLQYNSLPAGNYTFESRREWESGIFLLDVLCDIEYEPLNPKILQSNVADNSCNYFVRDDSIVPMDVCMGSHYPSDEGWSKKYTCVNGEAVILAYNTSNCASVPIHDKDTNTSFAEYNCNATNSCPYVFMTHYPMVYDMNIHDYICAPDMSSWHRGGEVIDFCRIRTDIGFTSSIIEYKDGNVTESYYVGYDCGITAPIKTEYVYSYNVLRDHHCCGEDFQSECEEMSDGSGTYIVIDYHSPVDTFTSTLDSFTTTLTNSNQLTTSNSALLTTTTDSNELKTTQHTITTLANSNQPTTSSLTTTADLNDLKTTQHDITTFTSTLDSFTTTTLTNSNQLTTSNSVSLTTTADLNESKTTQHIITTSKDSTFTSTLDEFRTTLTNSNKPTPSNTSTTTADSNKLKTTHATILLTKLRTNSTDKYSTDSITTEINASSCFVIELKWVHICILMVILMVMSI